jgi:hypothetical protein
MVVNRFDQASRYLVKLDPPGILSWLLRVPLEELGFRGWLDTRTLPFPGDPERTCDTVAWLRDPDPALEWALPVEFSLTPDPDLFGRLLVYLGQLWEEKRPTDVGGERFQVGAAVVNLTGRGRTSRSMRFRRTRVKTHLGVEEQNLEGENATSILRRIGSGELSRCLLPWVPLMTGGEKRRIIRRWLELAGSEQDSRRRSDFAGLAIVFAEAADRDEVWKEALRGWNMKESKQVLEWMAQGKAEGEAARAASDILRLLARRLPPGVPPDVAARIQATTDLQRLGDWFDLAIVAASVEGFCEAADL